MNRTPIRGRYGLKDRSAKQAKRERDLSKLKKFLIENRADGHCEVPGCGSDFGLQEHHIIHRSLGGKDIAGNIIIACYQCHDHSKVSGLPISAEEAIRIVGRKNKDFGIDPLLTGDEV